METKEMEAIIANTNSRMQSESRAVELLDGIEAILDGAGFLPPSGDPDMPLFGDETFSDGKSEMYHNFVDIIAGTLEEYAEEVCKRRLSRILGY